MFDFLKRKSYKIEEANGMKKIVVAKKVSKESFDEYINALTSRKEMLDKIINALSDLKDMYEKLDNLPKAMKDKARISIDYNFKSEDNLIKAFDNFDIRSLGKAVENKTEVEDKLGDIKQEESKQEEPKEEENNEKSSEETGEEGDKLDIESILSDVSTEDNQSNKEEGMEKKTSLSSKDLKRTADKAPGSSKYRAEGIKERLLEINKEVVNVKTPGVTYVGGVDKSVITPGPKSTSVKVKEEVVRPDIVVQNVKIRIMRDEGEKGKLLPEKNIKMPKGDVVVKKAATDNQKVKQLSEDKRAEYYAKKEKAKLENKSAEEFDKIDEEFGVSASLYDEAMHKIFAEEQVIEDTVEKSQDINEDNDLESLINRL